MLSNLLKIAVFIPVLLVISISLKQLLLGWNKQKIYVRLTMIMTVFSLLFIVIFTSMYQVEGVLFSLICSEALIILFYLLCIRKNWSLKKG